MKNIPRILLKTYLRRRPIHLRLARFNFLARYSWLKNLLEDLRPELFPPEPPPPAEEPTVEELDVDAISAHLLDAKVRGRQGVYQVERWLSQRGRGYLFAAQQLESKQAVILKEFLLPGRLFNPAEARQRQQQFFQLAGLTRTDGRSQDLRIIQPLDAIADTQSVERCYLITDERDASPTLRQQLQSQGPFPPEHVRQVLEQALQTLLHLHQQVMALPSGQRQFGLIHGNLTLDSILWVEYSPDRWFVYLTDLALWEKLFDPPTADRYDVTATPSAISQELRDLGEVGYALLTGQETLPEDVAPADLEIPQADPYLANFTEQLLTPYAFESAEAAWLELLSLPTLPPSEIEPAAVEAEAETPRRIPRWLIVLLGALLLALLGGTLWRVLSGRRPAIAKIVQVCCFKEVGAVPQGRYVYTSVAQKTWKEYDLTLTTLDNAASLPNRGRNLAVVAKIGNSFHVRIFNDIGQRILDRGNGEFTPDAPLAQELEEALYRASIDPRTQSDLIRKITASLGYTPWKNFLAMNLGRRGHTLLSSIQATQPDLTLDYVPSASTEAAIAAVQTGKVDFAVLSDFSDLELPSDLETETIAYDGLAVFVAFSYVKRRSGLPQSLQGELTLEDLKSLYVGRIENWREVSRNRSRLGITRYAPDNIEAIRFFERRVLDSVRLDQLANIETRETLPMLRAILQDFETQQFGGIGFAPLSQVYGQCSVYPLAIKAEQGEAAQPLVLNTGRAITPTLDLCNRKGVYFPNVEALRTGEYPLAYEIIIVFPQDNSRVPIGRKFAELLRTTEGQKLLRDAGLAPLNGVTP
ncbi:MAG: substrate-binding domain-containing protein [Leptolyngbyaceae cyanobacterium MO_188.B28]|nr:substrate-binding domain-containing protein [Leptolyngbyaceae cyanobacterium MO_188.B28]